MQALRSSAASARASARPSTSSRRSALVVRAEAAPPAAGAPAAAPKKKVAAPWVQPELDADTPSPIFGGSTGGLLRKAQVGQGMGESMQSHPPSLSLHCSVCCCL